MDLYEARAKRRLTQWDIGKATGISQSKMSLFENGYLYPNENEKGAIAEALGMEINEIQWPENMASK
jgi:DNA-binding XRE family transcriptional regulator